jgi:hypothetical protein
LRAAEMIAFRVARACSSLKDFISLAPQLEPPTRPDTSAIFEKPVAILRNAGLT